MSERVLVEFDGDDRGVLLDDRLNGRTNKAISTNTGTHKFSLVGEPDFTPSSQEHLVENTTVRKPFVVTFKKIAVAGGDDG